MRKLMMIMALILASSSAFAGSFNGSGTFVRSYNWTQDAANGIPIQASRFDTEDNGFATGLSTCVTKDGQTTPTSNLPMGGFRHTGVGQATARTHYAAASQVQDNTFGFCSEVGSTSNTYVVGSSPVAFTAYTTGMLVWFRAQSTNTTSATLNVNALGAIEIKKNGLTSVAAGDIVSGTYYGMLYDGVTNSFMPITPVTSVSASTITAASVSASSYAGVFTPGMVMPFAGTSATVPVSWTLAAGQSVSRTGVYGNLFLVIGTTYGSADGNSFNIPDLRGRVAAGVDNMGGTAANRISLTVAGISGTILGSAGGDQAMQSHTHTASVSDPGHFHNIQVASASGAPSEKLSAGSAGQNGTTTTGNPDTDLAFTGITVSNSTTGTGTSQNVQPTLMLNYIIRY